MSNVTNHTAYRTQHAAALPATCNVGDIFIDDTGGGQGFYACFAVNTWTGPFSTSTGITNAAGNNVIPKSNGTNLVASAITDDGSTVTSTEQIIAPSFKGSGSGAGYLELVQGTAPSLGTTSIQLVAPAAVTSYQIKLPGASTTGVFLGTNAANISTLSIVAPGSSGNVLTSDGTTWASTAPAGGSAPFIDSTAIIKGSGDATKLLKIEVDGFTTGTTRTITPPNSDTTLPIASQVITFAGPTAARTYTLPDAAATLARTDAANTFTGHQTIEGVATTGATGTGNLVFSASPTMTGTLTVPTLSMTGNISTNFITSNGMSVASFGSVIGIGGNADMTFNSGNITFSNGDLKLVSLFCSHTAPTVSGFGTSPSVVSSNGTLAFTINVGTGGAASTGTITFPAAANGWVVNCYNVTNPASSVTNQTGGTTTTATVTNYSRTTGLATAWTASDILRCTAVAY